MPMAPNAGMLIRRTAGTTSKVTANLVKHAHSCTDDAHPRARREDVRTLEGAGGGKTIRRTIGEMEGIPPKRRHQLLPKEMMMMTETLDAPWPMQQGQPKEDFHPHQIKDLHKLQIKVMLRKTKVDFHLHNKD